MLSRIVASHPVQCSVEAVQVLQERASNDVFAAKKFNRLPNSFRSGCARSMELRDVLEMGNPLSARWRVRFESGGSSSDTDRGCTDSGGVATVVAEAIPNDLAESHCGALGVISSC